MLSSLSRSEEKNIRLKALGFIEKEIADKRCVSLHTVKTQVKMALKKTGVKSCYELVARYAIAHPDIFKQAIAILFVALQCLMICDIEDIEVRQRRGKKGKAKITSVRSGRKPIEFA